MSHHLSNQAWDIELRGPRKIVLLCLAHLAVLSTRECPATVRKIAYMCGMSDSGVRDQLAALAAEGLVDEIRGDGATFYRVNVAPRDA
jgi:DNA-binding IscR family transcriptional regulator